MPPACRPPDVEDRADNLAGSASYGSQHQDGREVLRPAIPSGDRFKVTVALQPIHRHPLARQVPSALHDPAVTRVTAT